jgi:hypothetical protein
MAGDVTIVNENPLQDGITAGKALGASALKAETKKLLAGPHLKNNLGAMSRKSLDAYVTARLSTQPDAVQYPELAELYPDRVEFIVGIAQGAGVTTPEAAVYHYVKYKTEIDAWYWSLQVTGAGAPTPEDDTHCSGILMRGPDGIIGAHSAESGPPPAPKGYKPKPPRPYKGTKILKPVIKDITVVKPRTGYISSWGVTNEKGVGCAAGVSCSIWLDDPIVDTWPVHNPNLLRWATDIKHFIRLYTRYTTHVWSRASQVWADTSGDGCIVEKSFRRIGVRWIGSAPAIWCTEGHFQTDEMSLFARQRRLEYLARAGKHLGCEDMQYYTDCAVRFTHIGELCYRPWGHNEEHMRKVLVNTDTFPRGINRVGGPDTDPSDPTITMVQTMTQFTKNRSHARNWIPYKKFVHEVPEHIVQYPARPGAI